MSPNKAKKCRFLPGINHNDTIESSSTVHSYRKFLVKLGITLSILAYLGFKVDWDKVRTTIFSIKLLPFLGSYLLLLLCSIPLAIRLRILIKPTVLKFTLGQLIQIQFISHFYSLLLPSGVGMSIARWYQITRNKIGRRVFAVITLIERGMLIITLLLCTGVPLYFSKDEAIQNFRNSVLPVVFVLIIGCFFFFSIFLHPWAHHKFSSIMQWLRDRFTSDWIGKLFGVYEDCSLYLNERHLLIQAFLIHLCYQGVNFFRFYFAFVALDVNLPLLTILWITMLLLLVLTVPVSISGIGVREAAFSWLLSFYSIEPEKGLLLGGMISIQVFLNVVLGAILNMCKMKRTEGSLQR